jgi:hypothetical protein
VLEDAREPRGAGGELGDVALILPQHAAVGVAAPKDLDHACCTVCVAAGTEMSPAVTTDQSAVELGAKHRSGIEHNPVPCTVAGYRRLDHCHCSIARVTYVDCTSPL